MRVIKTNKSVAGLAGPTWSWTPADSPQARLRKWSHSELGRPRPLKNRVTSARFSIFECSNACFINTNKILCRAIIFPTPGRRLNGAYSSTSTLSSPPIARELSFPTPASVRAALCCPPEAGGRAARKPTGGPAGDILADPAYSFAPLRQRGRRSFAQPRTNWPAPLQGTHSMQVAGNFPVHITVPALTRFPDA